MKPQWQAIREQAARSGYRRLVFGAILAQTELYRILELLESFPSEGVDDDFLGEVQSEIAAVVVDAIEHQIDDEFPGYAWDYEPIDLNSNYKPWDSARPKARRLKDYLT